MLCLISFGPVVRVLLAFNFIIQLKFMLFYFFQLDPYYFFFVKVIFHFNLTIQLKFLACLLMYFFYFDFNPYSFNYIFFKILLCNWFFFHVSSFDIWFVRDWPLYLFHLLCLWSNDPCHRFEKLMSFVFFLFFCLFSFTILSFYINFFFKRLVLRLFSIYFLWVYFGLMT